MTTALKRTGAALLTLLMFCMLTLGASAAANTPVGVKFWKENSDKESMANSGKLYGKVTGKEVAELLTALTGTEIDKKKVELPSAIKEFGSYDASVRLYAGVVAPFKLKVEEL